MKRLCAYNAIVAVAFLVIWTLLAMTVLRLRLLPLAGTLFFGSLPLVLPSSFLVAWRALREHPIEARGREAAIATVLMTLVLVPLGLLLYGPSLTQYSIFRHRDDEYYAELVKACNSLLEAHPVGPASSVAVSAGDPSVPRIIRQLQPLKIQIEPHRVWMVHGGSIHFGITWQQALGRTDAGILSTCCEDDTRVVYVAGKDGT
jgi:hypothetical protein